MKRRQLSAIGHRMPRWKHDTRYTNKQYFLIIFLSFFYVGVVCVCVMCEWCVWVIVCVCDVCVWCVGVCVMCEWCVCACLWCVCVVCVERVLCVCVCVTCMCVCVCVIATHQKNFKQLSKHVMPFKVTWKLPSTIYNIDISTSKSELTNRYLKQLLRYINSIDLEKINQM
jgi:hypothetical protein